MGILLHCMGSLTSVTNWIFLRVCCSYILACEDRTLYSSRSSTAPVGSFARLKAHWFFFFKIFIFRSQILWWIYSIDHFHLFQSKSVSWGSRWQRSFNSKNNNLCLFIFSSQLIKLWFQNGIFWKYLSFARCGEQKLLHVPCYSET